MGRKTHTHHLVHKLSNPAYCTEPDRRKSCVTSRELFCVNMVLVSTQHLLWSYLRAINRKVSVATDTHANHTQTILSPQTNKIAFYYLLYICVYILQKVAALLRVCVPRMFVPPSKTEGFVDFTTGARGVPMSQPLYNSISHLNYKCTVLRCLT